VGSTTIVPEVLLRDYFTVRSNLSCNPWQLAPFLSNPPHPTCHEFSCSAIQTRNA
jgi:hypothetical protein